MDTAHQYRMAILMALQGGIGVIHYNYPTIEDQMAEVQRVRRHGEAGFAESPRYWATNHEAGEVHQLPNANGFHSYPVTEDGTLASKLVGIVTRCDVRYCEDPSQPVASIMTP